MTTPAAPIPEAFSPAARRERCRLFRRSAVRAARAWYDAGGNWIAASIPPETRERYWLACALYAEGEDALADAVIRRGKTESVDLGVTSNFNIFHTNTAAILLRKFAAKMAPEVRRSLEDVVRGGFNFEPGNRRCDFQFHGYNDNMPAEAGVGLILGGELLGEAAPVEHGLWNLRQMRAMLQRRGTHSEWNSPTYSPITLHCCADIAAHARNEEARDLARKIEERLWLDFAARFHPELGALAGPYSRAYPCDYLAHLSIASSLLWLVLGDIAKPSPMDLFEEGDNGLVLHHEGDAPFNIAQMCVLSDDIYHLPAKAAALFARKAYPFRAVATAEQGDTSPEGDASPLRIESVLEADFAVGTSDFSFLSGVHCATYAVLYKRAAEVASYRDRGTIYHGLFLDDEAPGDAKTPVDKDGKPYSNSGEIFIPSHATMATVQSHAAVLAVTHPQLALGGTENGRPSRAVRRMSEMVVFPSHFGGADEARIGGRALDGWSGEARHGEWIGCRRGRLLHALRPLAYTDGMGAVRVTLERLPGYEVVRAALYDGPERAFTRPELRRFFGGFVAEHASIDDYPSLAAFLEELSPARFTDQFWTTRRVRYRRPAGRRPATEMEISWSPGAAVARFATVDGRLPSGDRVAIDSLEERDFPFLNEPWISVPSYFPWPRLFFANTIGPVGDREGEGEIA